MAFNDVPLNDAGGNYYAQQFGNRVQNIRKGATPPSPRNAGCLGTGGATGGGIFAIIVVVRILIAIGSSGYDSDNSYTPPTINYDPPPVWTPPPDWNNNPPDGGWPDQPLVPPVIEDPNPPVILDPNPPAIEVPNPPPVVPGGDDNQPEKND